MIAFYYLSGGSVAVSTWWVYIEFDTFAEAHEWAEQAIAVCALVALMQELK